ncbi:hypothetical protein ACQ4PT_049890 [Festuca glaucescens]
MEATGVSIGKSVLDVALGCAKSAVAEEISLQLGVHRDKAFVTGELEMMRSFLVVAHDEQDDHRKVVMTWVKQVHDVAYDVEDCLQDFVVRLQKKKQSWWRIPRTPIDRRNVAKQMMDLRAGRGRQPAECALPTHQGLKLHRAYYCCFCCHVWC